MTKKDMFDEAMERSAKEPFKDLSEKEIDAAVEKIGPQKEMSKGEIADEIKDLEKRMSELVAAEKAQVKAGRLTSEAMDKVGKEIGDLAARVNKLRKKYHFSDLSEKEIDIAVGQMEPSSEETEAAMKETLDISGKKLAAEKKTPSWETRRAMKEVLDISGKKLAADEKAAREKQDETDLGAALDKAAEEEKGLDLDITVEEPGEEKPIAETEAEKEFFKKKPEYSEPEAEHVASMTTEEQIQMDQMRMSQIDLRAADLKETLKKAGIKDPDAVLQKMAVSRWGRIKSGFLSLFGGKERMLNEYSKLTKERADLYETIAMDKIRLTNPEAARKIDQKKGMAAIGRQYDAARKSAEENKPLGGVR